MGNGQALASIDETGYPRQMLSSSAGVVTLYGQHGIAMVAGSTSGNYINDPAGTATIAVTPGVVNVGGATVPPMKLDGLGSLSLAEEAACLDTGTLDRFVIWSDGAAYSCTQQCATVGCNGIVADAGVDAGADAGITATCVHGLSVFAGALHYRYGTECGTASTAPGVQGKLCCCTGTGCAQPMYR
jgi:hypothetical protein